MEIRNVIKGILVAIIAVVILIGAAGVYQSEKDAIEETLLKQGAEHIQIELQTTAIGSPFFYVDKNDLIYKVDYQLEGKSKTAWVRYGLIPDWRFQEN